MICCMPIKHYRICCRCEERLNWSMVHCPRCNRLTPSWRWVVMMAIVTVLVVMTLFKLMELIDGGAASAHSQILECGGSTPLLCSAMELPGELPFDRFGATLKAASSRRTPNQ